MNEEIFERMLNEIREHIKKAKIKERSAFFDYKMRSAKEKLLNRRDVASEAAEVLEFLR